MNAIFELSTQSDDMNYQMNLKTLTRLQEQIMPIKTKQTQGMLEKKQIYQIQHQNASILYRYSRNENEKELNERFYLSSDGKPYPEIWNKQRVILCIQSLIKLPQNYLFHYIRNCTQEKEKVHLQYNLQTNCYEVHIQQDMNDEELKLKIENFQFDKQKYQNITVVIDKKHFIQYRNAYKVIIKQNDLLNCVQQQQNQIQQNGIMKVVDKKIQNLNLQNILQFVESLIDYNEKCQKDYMNNFERQFLRHQQIMNNINPQISELSKEVDQLFSYVNEIDQDCQNMKLNNEKLFLSNTQIVQNKEPMKYIFLTQINQEMKINNFNINNDQFLHQVQPNVDMFNLTLGQRDQIVQKSSQQIQIEQQDYSQIYLMHVNQNIEEYQTNLLKFNENLVKQRENFELKQKQIQYYQNQILNLKETISQCNKRIEDLQNKNKQLLELREQNLNYIVQLIRSCSRRFIPSQLQAESIDVHQNCQLEKESRGLNRSNSQRQQRNFNKRIIKQCSRTPKQKQ